MSDQEFESYLRLLGRFLRLTDSQREAIASELRDHMEERLCELLERGYSREDALRTALDEFGDAASLAADFGRVGRRRRWIMRTTAATVGIAATILIVSFLLPEHRAYVPAPSLTMAESGGSGGFAKVPATLPAGKATRPRGASAAVPIGESAAEREAREQLARTLATVEFSEGTSLAEILEYVRANGNLSIDVNWNAFQLVGIDKATDSQGLHLKNVRVDRLLQILLENVGAASGAELGYSVVDGLVRISTTEDLDRHLIVRVYDCQDLIRRPLSSEQKAMLQSLSNPGAAGVEEGAMGGGFGAGGGSLNSGQLLASVYDKEAARLTELLRSTIAPGSWEPESPLGSVREYDGLLVIRHTWKVHQSIAEFLGLLRQARAARDGHADSALSLSDEWGPISRAAAEQIVAVPPQLASSDGVARHPSTRPAR